jgi:hypothetical protein
MTTVRCFAAALFLLGLCLNCAKAQGPLTNGWTHTGAISPAGDSDSWTFSATVGDTIFIRVGEITQSGNFTPRIRLQNPAAVQVSAASGAVAAQISVTATNTGTFTVIVDDAVGTTATGTYRLTLAKSPGAVAVAPGDEGGPLTNGVMHTAAIDVGDLDVWTFTASAGENLTVRMGELSSGSALTPALWLYGPNGALLDSFAASGFAAEVSVRATNSGTFTVVAGDFSGGFAGSGGYRLTLAKTGESVVVSAGDEGGALVNGVMHTGTIDVGDLDVWTFTANAGANLTLRMGEMLIGSPLTPALWLYGPNGVLLDSFGSSAVAAEVSVRATNSGTFTVVAGDFSGGFAGSGAYRLTLAKTGEPVIVSSGDQGGPLTNGVMHTGTIDVGDLDVWTFTANAGENLTLRVGEMVIGSPLTPALWLYGPNGALLDSFGSSVAAAEVSVRATNSGTFIVVAGDFSSGFAGSGAYRLTLAKTGDAVVVSEGDEGGPMANGLMHTGMVDTGDLDIWTFTANAGDNVVVRMGELTNGSPLTPALWLYGPNGALLDSFDDSAVAAEVTARATNSGAFIVVAGDFSGGFAGSGSYRLTLAKTGSPILVSPGDQGGALIGSNAYDGALDIGDLDVFLFTACLGDNFVLQMDEVIAGSSLTPWLRLFGRDGILLRSASGAAIAQVSAPATNSGTFIVVASDLSGGYDGAGGYRFTANGLSAGMKLCHPKPLGNDLNLQGIGGDLGATFILSTHTNVTAPVGLWVPIWTNQFDLFGVFSYTNALDRAEPKRFFLLQQQ